MWLNRIRKEIKDIQKEPLDGIILEVDEKDMKIFNGTIEGPSGTPYAGFLLHIKITIPETYPLEPPKVIFKHPLYHPNVSLAGDICLDILKTQWAPTLCLSKIMLSISSLLNDPNPSSPLNSTAANYWLNDKTKYNKEVIDLCNKHKLNINM